MSFIDNFLRMTRPDSFQIYFTDGYQPLQFHDTCPTIHGLMVFPVSWKTITRDSFLSPFQGCGVRDKWNVFHIVGKFSNFKNRKPNKVWQLCFQEFVLLYQLHCLFPKRFRNDLSTNRTLSAANRKSAARINNSTKLISSPEYHRGMQRMQCL